MIIFLTGTVLAIILTIRVGGNPVAILHVLYANIPNEMHKNSLRYGIQIDQLIQSGKTDINFN